ncbi:hypothetical protein COCON_G00084870 [Conger conger]|uniref:Uncharacterized protein n=1 Tax=Conger conger TaxID=82655 RepID=A0A9Q1DQ99_CONCO|nr:hypothetical protein COCON_G00084870 [Conger conger]
MRNSTYRKDINSPSPAFCFRACFELRVKGPRWLTVILKSSLSRIDIWPSLSTRLGLSRRAKNIGSPGGSFCLGTSKTMRIHTWTISWLCLWFGLTTSSSVVDIVPYFWTE